MLVRRRGSEEQVRRGGREDCLGKAKRVWMKSIQGGWDRNVEGKTLRHRE